MPEPLEIATTPWSWGAIGSADSLCQQAEDAEAMGFHSFWLPENHFGGRRAIPSPLTLLAAVAARTRKIKLGCTSYLLPIRHPLLAAEEVAVLDQLCGGRLILGVGRGMQGDMFKAFGISPSDKRRLFLAHLDIMRRAWRGEPVVEDDNDEPIVLAPLPLQQPSPPIWVAAFGPLALRQVAGLGLPYLASPVESLQVLAQNYQQYHQMVDEAGHPAVQIMPVMRTVLVTEDSALATAARLTLARVVPPSMKAKAACVEDWAIVGDQFYVRDKLSEYRECLAISHLIVRAGLSGVTDLQQLHSHEQLLHIASSL
jgi:alkanesulfonate monooxygenase SsuD/methylene tetrahydromethanopterin reductase-like flavin-dependent oxidoreductase (luciferase family)